MLDCCIIGAGASGLFLGMQLPKSWRKLILEQRDSAGTKLILSGKGRCNFTNLKTSFKTYLGDQTERLHQIFAQFCPKDMIALLEYSNIFSKEEDNGRILLASNKSKELLDFFLTKNEENQTQIQYATQVKSIEKSGEYFTIITTAGRFDAKRVVIATGGKSFPMVGGSDFVFDFAKDCGLMVKEPAPALCGINTREDVSLLSGSSIQAQTKLFINGKQVYEDDCPVLFTHWGVSGPAIFNLSLRLGYFDPFLQKKSQIKIAISAAQMTKRLFAYLKVSRGLKNYILTLTPEHLRSYDEAKVMSGGLCFSEVNDGFELKKIPRCYVLGEALNVTGKTGGYNLQRCWSSASVCAKKMLEEK